MVLVIFSFLAITITESRLRISGVYLCGSSALLTLKKTRTVCRHSHCASNSWLRMSRIGRTSGMEVICFGV